MKNSDTLGRPSINRHLPTGHRLTYVVDHEQWFMANQDAAPARRRVSVRAEEPDGSAPWSFDAIEHAWPGGYSGVCVKVFDDAYAAFTQVPDLFQALAQHGRMTCIEEFVAVLNELGIEDVTQRTAPSNPKENR